MNTTAQPEAADEWRTLLLYSARDGVRDLRTAGIGITELGVRSVRNFFFELLTSLGRSDNGNP